MYMYRTQPAQMSLRCQFPASCALAWAVQQFSNHHAHAQLSFVYLLSTARADYVILDPRLPSTTPALAQFTPGGRREPADKASDLWHSGLWFQGTRGVVKRAIQHSASPHAVSPSQSHPSCLKSLYTYIIYMNNFDHHWSSVHSCNICRVNISSAYIYQSAKVGQCLLECGTYYLSPKLFRTMIFSCVKVYTLHLLATA